MVVPYVFFRFSILIKVRKKPKGTTLCFVKKMEQNGISGCKINFLNNFDKTWCSRVNSKFKRFFPKNTKILIPKQLCSSGDSWPKFGGGAYAIITQRFNNRYHLSNRKSEYASARFRAALTRWQRIDLDALVLQKSRV